jgi:hypothetical protein
MAFAHWKSLFLLAYCFNINLKEANFPRDK